LRNFPRPTLDIFKQSLIEYFIDRRRLVFLQRFLNADLFAVEPAVDFPLLE
jgi:hypothetical protein